MYSPKSKALALIPKFTGFLSFAGSTLIFQDIVRDQKKRGRVYHRLVLGLSTFDIMASIVNVLSTWPIPAGTKGVYLASGTTQTCTAQGFFNETGNMSTPMYNASLCVYYLLIIRSGWSEQRLKKVEPFLHAVPLTIGWTMGILGLPLDLYNNSGWLCWIAPHPSRGHHANLFRWIHYGLIWSAILFVTVGMFLIYRTVRQKEKESERFDYEARLRQHTQEEQGDISSGKRRSSLLSAITNGSTSAGGGDGKRSASSKNSRRVAHQAMLFVFALYMTWVFTTLTRIFQIVHGKTYFPLLVLMATFFPLQGFFNAMIYLRPRIIRCRARHPNLGWFAILASVLKADGSDCDDADFTVSTATRSLSKALGSARRRISGVFQEVAIRRASKCSMGSRRGSHLSSGSRRGSHLSSGGFPSSTGSLDLRDSDDLDNAGNTLAKMARELEQDSDDEESGPAKIKAIGCASEGDLGPHLKQYSQDMQDTEPERRSSVKWADQDDGLNNSGDSGGDEFEDETAYVQDK